MFRAFKSIFFRRESESFALRIIRTLSFVVYLLGGLVAPIFFFQEVADRMIDDRSLAYFLGIVLFVWYLLAQIYITSKGEKGHHYEH